MSTGSAVPLSPTPTPRTTGALVRWAAWDWGSASFNAVITTFVFTVYLTSGVAADEASGSAALANTIAIAGILVAVTAPVYGQRSDASGAEQGRQRRLGLLTAVIVVASALMFLVQGSPSYLLLGLVLLGVGTFAYELAQVEYNAMIYRLAPPGRTGWVSGVGWSAGYLGGIVLLIGCLVLFIEPIGVITFDSPDMGPRVIALVCAAWFALFAIPVLFMRFPYPAPPGDVEAASVSWLGSYKLLVQRLIRLGRTDRHLLGFLVASAIYRDGLTAVFTFGGVLAAGTFGLSASEVIFFAIAANVVSAVGAVVGGRLDDRIGPKPVILVSLAALVVVAGALLPASGKPAFWIGGLFLCLFVGPAQACSRSYLARLVPPGREGELFGLYATTGRAVSFLAPALFGLFITVFGEQRWGILGIGIVLLLGFLALLPVRGVPGNVGAGNAAVGH
ncbi:MFS transporter [Actinomycetospora termitidis]|uniref:MFS transporter n=1 Tax=Actinomycetospora termitidis TaxID=3053470 RepID=A0ABT7M3R6_9PSEU|nr:MFS transporter [Actinomycetospora sp. Odt1-22]MDL5154647.1 MFS transporter [Actinomycetospora sp. Odt1-22]